MFIVFYLIRTTSIYRLIMTKTQSEKTQVYTPKTDARDSRTWEQIQEHYQIEQELARQLMNSSREERINGHLYTEVYNQLFQKVPHHPQLTRKSSPEIQTWIVNQRLQLLARFLNPKITYLEIGPGDCSLSLEVAKRVKRVYAVDVSTEITKLPNIPDNMEIFISDGCSIPVPENTVDLAYSHQLMEHLHPDDALEQLENIYNTLAANGKYICITPNWYSGPHDVSRHFDQQATGFHLKEYKLSEMYDIFNKVGFSKIIWVKSNGKIYLEIPINSISINVIKLVEYLLNIFPYKFRQKIANTPLLFRGMTIIGCR
ncbi:MAG: class I SAM-dependent methyltransferase [Arthrospira sp. PLM2.Bin9]|nr:MAG: class I SAM-dependent methyltransferase [Arthrospira sp. PLM2.Bin9]